MNKKLVVMIMFFLNIFAKAQTSVYHPFPESNAIWNIDCSAWPCNNSNQRHEYFTYTISGDTVINSIKYHKWHIPFVIYANNCDSLNFAGYVGAFRNDIPNKKVYYIRSKSKTEYILYDFNVKVGDTIKNCGVNEPYTMRIRVEDSVLVGGNYRKQWHAYSIDGGSVNIIEGIGGTFGPINYCSAIDPPFSNLACFSQNGDINYPNVSPCSIISSTNSIDVKFTASLSPNPFHFSALLTLSNAFEYADLKIYNTLGKQVRQQKIISQTTIINGEGLRPGIYLFQINNSKGNLTNGKFVIK